MLMLQDHEVSDFEFDVSIKRNEKQKPARKIPKIVLSAGKKQKKR